MASVRCLDNALEVEVGGTMVPITANNGVTQIPDNGRVIRNLIHGADTVMSHITHFYALAALDYADASYLGPVWDPYYTDLGTDAILNGNSTIMPNGVAVVTNYVESLTMRRKCHSLSAILSGRHPIQNAIVPGGVTTLPTASDIEKFSELLDTVRNFINTAYVPDVYTIATHPAVSKHWLTGTNPQNLLSYGDFPIQRGTGAETLLLKRGLVVGGGLSYTAGPTDFLSNVTEDVGYSYYSSASGLTPDVGETTPDVSLVSDATTQYSWLKAPRFNQGTDSYVCQVGPLPRMFVSYLQSGTHDPVVSEAAATSVPVASTVTLGLTGGTYKLSDLVVNTLGAASTKLGLGSLGGAGILMSTLGRHACRMLETKLIADAMADTGLTLPAQSWVTELKAGDGTNGLSSPVYVYAKLPKRIKTGAGWAEAPRGALGHWITIDKKRIANYQCVVPSTWNHSPRDDQGRKGAAEESLMNQLVGSTTDQRIMNALRHLHTWDFCIACAVHIVRPDGSTISKFKMDTDGKVTKLPHDAEI
jgi:hydrogenase large subunit